MNNQDAVSLLESLASGTRLDIYRLLVATAPDGLVAGRIADAMALPATNTSFHLKALTVSGLVSVQQEGRYLRYRANLPRMQALINFLTAECCQGDPGLCDFPAPSGCQDRKPS